MLSLGGLQSKSKQKPRDRSGTPTIDANVAENTIEGARSRGWAVTGAVLLILFLIALTALIVGAIALQKARTDGDERQIVTAAGQTIDDDADYVVFKRSDWFGDNLVVKCAVYQLPTGSFVGKKLRLINRYRQCNVLVHPNYLTLDSEFWQLTLYEEGDTVELDWIENSVGWAVVNEVGKLNVVSLQPDQQRYLYVLCTAHLLPFNPSDARDFIATIDVGDTSITYGQIVDVALGSKNLTWEISTESGSVEYHSGDLFSSTTGDWMVAPSLQYDNPAIDFYDIFTNDRAPTLSTSLNATIVMDTADVGALNSVHINPQTGSILIVYMGSTSSNSGSPGGLLLISPNTATHTQNTGLEFSSEDYYENTVTGLNTQDDELDDYAYDFQIEPCLNVLVATSLGPPSQWTDGYFPDNALGRGVRVFQMPDEQFQTNLNGPSPLTLIASFTTDPIYKMGGSEDDSLNAGLVPLTVRRVHYPGRQYYYVAVLQPGAIALVWCDPSLTGETCDGEDGWTLDVVVTAEQLAADAVNADVVTNLGDVPNMPFWDDPFGRGSFPVPFVVDLTVSTDDQFLYVSCWLAGAVLQYYIGADPFEPVLTGGFGNLGGVTDFSPGDHLFNPNAYQWNPPYQKWAAGPSRLRLDQSGTQLYVSNSWIASWDDQFYPTVGLGGDGSIIENCGQLIALNTGVANGVVTDQYPVTANTNFGTNFGTGGVVPFCEFFSPEVSDTFYGRTKESHIRGVTH
jgi:hypothetical protein